MRMLPILGVILIVGGLFVGIRGLNYSADREVLRVGGLEASVEERRSVPAWVGWVGAGAGLVLLVAGMRGTRRA